MISLAPYPVRAWRRSAGGGEGEGGALTEEEGQHKFGPSSRFQSALGLGALVRAAGGKAPQGEGEARNGRPSA